MAQNPKSENDVRSLQQWYPKYLEHLFDAISYNPEVHSGTSCLVATVVSQFVTVAICDDSEHNFSDRFHSNRGYTPKYRKHAHIKIGPFQEGFLGTSIMGFITDIHTHKQIYQWNKTKVGQKWTWVLSQVPRTRFQCYWTQFVPSRLWSQIAINHKLPR